MPPSRGRAASSLAPEPPVRIASAAALDRLAAPTLKVIDAAGSFLFDGLRPATHGGGLSVAVRTHDEESRSVRQGHRPVMLHRSSARAEQLAAYTRSMPLRDVTLQAGTVSLEVERDARTVDPTTHLAAVYRDYPGLRALILRRVRDPELAADILQDAAVTTLEKLRNGEIAQPENVGGYLYRVALNHLRNHRRKDRTALSSSEGLHALAHPAADPDWTSVGHPEWSAAARRMLGEMPTPRDRDLLVRFYLNDEAKESICSELGLSDEHFNRVIFRARNRFRSLLERHGFGKSDFLAIAALSVGLSATAAGLIAPGPACAAAPSIETPATAISSSGIVP